ncbi:MAG: DUF6249 domain-containing protein [bacterium]
MQAHEAIPIVLMVLFSIGGPVAIVIVAIVMNHLSKKKRYEAMVKAIELGAAKDPEVIKQLFMAEKPKENSDGSGYLKGGIVVSGIGLGLFAMGLALGDGGLFGPSAFMFILGLALVLVHLVIRPKDKKK